MTIPDDDILPEYSLGGGVRGKYADQYARSTAEQGEPLEEADEIEAEAHRRYLELSRDEAEGVDGDDVIRQLRERRQRTPQSEDDPDSIRGSEEQLRHDAEQAWDAEAHRRWEAYLRGEEEMILFEDVMTEIRGRRARSEQSPSSERPFRSAEGPLSLCEACVRAQTSADGQKVHSALGTCLFALPF